jgi:hypothetical protein
MPMGSATPGPQHLFVRFRGNTAVYYLGTCVASPEQEIHKDRIPIMNDISGRSNPLQIIKDGQNAIVYATMNRFDWLLLQSIRGLDATNVLPATPAAGSVLAGWEGANVRGTFQIGLTDFQLIVWSQYNDVPGAAGQFGGGVSVGVAPVRLYSSVDLSDMKETTQGTRVLEVACAFKMVSVYAPTTLSFGGGSNNAIAGLYTENLSVMGFTTAQLAALVAAAGA